MANEEKLAPVYERYPGTQYVVALETDLQRIARDLQSRSVTAWGQGPIHGTNFYKLADVGPQHKGDKTLVIVATLEDVKKARKYAAQNR